jgi:(1->4)-alpha-D-glucan 1-alpha-D-glucosylmutase
MIPHATYRLQFHKDFPFAAALPLVPYLKRLGISHVYASPILKARAGSMHGYDVTDHATINPELGGEMNFRALAAELRTHGMGMIVDIVPNHMAVDADNPWWMDVLENGRGSRFANHFDIDWDAQGGKVLTAFLGKPYWEALEAGELKLARDDSGKLVLQYFDRMLPLRPEDQSLDPESFSTPGALHEMLERQHYRLAWWRTANDTINWRRFFDISDLIALKQETPGVFEESHAKIFALYREGLIDGVRIDHVDGLADPAAYCRRLRSEMDELARQRPEPDPHPYIVVEKILGAGEALPTDWGIDGTTGYDFMNEVSALQHDAAGAGPLGKLWHEISGRPAEFEPEEELARAEIVESAFEAALARTAQSFAALARLGKAAGAVSEASLRRGLVRLLQHLRVYRTYATGADASPAPGPEFDAAVNAAKAKANGTDRAAIAFIADVMRGGGAVPENRRDAVRRFNHLSAPVAAKAVEDTAFYRYGRLLSRNDVGFNPGAFASPVAEFHRAMIGRAQSFPHAMLATATHDHKRGEDVRARLAVLSEMPEAWAQAVRSWMQMNAQHRPRELDRGDEYQLYQILVGAWPLDLEVGDREGLSAFCGRVWGWRQKSLREAKLHTSWLDPDEAYEKANENFLRAILDSGDGAAFLESIASFVTRIAPAGALNGLVQAALRCTAPGVPDCYQGTEYWDLSLVDPDNRRPVDYAARRESLQHDTSPLELLAHWRDGTVKQAVIASLLNLRIRKPLLFAAGDYQPLEVRGARADKVAAFLRPAGGDALLVAVPLHCAAACADRPLTDARFWGDTEIVLPEGSDAARLRPLFGDGATEGGTTLPCRTLFAQFPVAVFA